MPSETDRPEEIRQALISQVAHLLDELDALRGQLHVIPEPVLTARPMDSEPSFAEIYQQLVRFDEDVCLPALHELIDAQTPKIGPLNLFQSPPESHPSDLDFASVLDDIRSARTELVALLESLPLSEWDRAVVVEGEAADVFTLAYLITQHDAALLQVAALRLHESRLTQRENERSR